MFCFDDLFGIEVEGRRFGTRPSGTRHKKWRHELKSIKWAGLNAAIE